VSWVVEIGDEFEPEFDELHKDVRTDLLALTACCSNLGRNWDGPALTR
jgi:hypothetical protein